MEREDLQPETANGDEAAPETKAAGEKTATATKPKKKKKLVTVKLSLEKVDQLLSSHPTRARPYPAISEEQLAKIADPATRERLREVMARAAASFYRSWEKMKREQELIREEIAALGYATAVLEIDEDEDLEQADGALMYSWIG